MLRRRGLSLALLSALAVFAGLLVWWLRQEAPPAQAQAHAPLGLFTTLPIFWGETADISETISGTVPPHWARAAIERQYRLAPLDVLTVQSIGPLNDLLLAQPRALSPEENVTLDNWLTTGGRLLLFADPLLTSDSRFALGDPRRPADTALLSPILARWGLELTFDPEQDPAPHPGDVFGNAVPLEMAGRLVLLAPQGDTAPECKLAEGGVAAECRIGGGRVLVVADAALLDGDAPDPAARADALSSLLARAYRAN
jgi:hypothetical protein